MKGSEVDNWQEFRTHGLSHQCSATELRPLDNYTSLHNGTAQMIMNSLMQPHTQQPLRMCCQNYCKSDALFDFHPLLAFYNFL